MKWSEFSTFHSNLLNRILDSDAADRSEGRKILPAAPHIFRAFRETPFEKINVVCIGQDPYPNRTHAMGLAFSVPSECSPLPPSLVNIFKELQADVGVIGKDTLLPWTRQGVLLLNTALTVVEGQPGSHRDRWKQWTHDLLQEMVAERDDIVFLLWGAFARNVANFAEIPARLRIETTHPSPFSAHDGFLGSRCFSKVNNRLIELGRSPINWSLIQ